MKTKRVRGILLGIATSCILAGLLLTSQLATIGIPKPRNAKAFESTCSSLATSLKKTERAINRGVSAGRNIKSALIKKFTSTQRGYAQTCETPVCGFLPTPCGPNPEELCIQQISETTYPSFSALKRAGATLGHLGECKV